MPALAISMTPTANLARSGTGSSNPLPSSAESAANLRFGGASHRLTLNVRFIRGQAFWPVRFGASALPGGDRLSSLY